MHAGVCDYGKIDKVPGLFYITTEFIHLLFVPLIPLRSSLVVEGSEKFGKWKAVSIPLNLKSVAFGWIQVYCPVLGVIGSLMREGVDAWAWMIPAPVAWLLLVVWITTFFYNRASPKRAFELAPLLGLTPEQIAGAFVSQEEIPQLLARHEIAPSTPTDTTTLSEDESDG